MNLQKLAELKRSWLALNNNEPPDPNGPLADAWTWLEETMAEIRNANYLAAASQETIKYLNGEKASAMSSASYWIGEADRLRNIVKDQEKVIDDLRLLLKPAPAPDPAPVHDWTKVPTGDWRMLGG
jgi:hypothetical protein